MGQAGTLHAQELQELPVHGVSLLHPVQIRIRRESEGVLRFTLMSHSGFSTLKKHLRLVITYQMSYILGKFFTIGEPAKLKSKSNTVLI